MATEVTRNRAPGRGAGNDRYRRDADLTDDSRGGSAFAQDARDAHQLGNLRAHPEVRVARASEGLPLSCVVGRESRVHRRRQRPRLGGHMVMLKYGIFASAELANTRAMISSVRGRASLLGRMPLIHRGIGTGSAARRIKRFERRGSRIPAALSHLSYGYAPFRANKMTGATRHPRSHCDSYRSRR